MRLAIVVLLFGFAAAQSGPTCPFSANIAPIPSSKVPVWQDFEGGKYALITDQRSFEQAEATCAYLGASLTSIHKAAQAAFLNFFMNADVMFVGGVHSSANGNCWSDASPVDYNVFPNATGRYCLTLTKYGAVGYIWDKRDCNHPAPFICKKLPYVPTTPPPSPIACPFVSDRSPIYTGEPLWSHGWQKKYAYIASPKNFLDAQASCEYLGANLASVHSLTDNAFTASLVPYGSFAWIGGLSPGYRNYCWTDATGWNYDEFSGVDLYPNCIQVTKDLKWIQQKCDYQAGYICEKST